MITQFMTYDQWHIFTNVKQKPQKQITSGSLQLNPQFN